MLMMMMVCFLFSFSPFLSFILLSFSLHSSGHSHHADAMDRKANIRKPLSGTLHITVHDGRDLDHVFHMTQTGSSYQPQHFTGRRRDTLPRYYKPISLDQIFGRHEVHMQKGVSCCLRRLDILFRPDVYSINNLASFDEQQSLNHKTCVEISKLQTLPSIR